MNLPEGCGDSSIHRSKMPDYPARHKIVVLAGLAGINIELRHARPEIAHFSPQAKPADQPHIQSQADLQRSGGGSRFASARNLSGAFAETPDASS